MATPDEYFDRCLHLLDRYRWLHDIKMTECLIRKPWMEMPEEWKSWIGTSSPDAIASSSSEKDFPPSLKEFLAECRLLTLSDQRPLSFLSMESSTTPFRLSSIQRRRLTAKKIHEVERLAPLIERICEKSGCRLVVDLGCGMGYLAQILVESFDLRVMALDPILNRRIRYANFKLGRSAEDSQRLETMIADFEEEETASDCVLVSLHGCGELQPLAYEIFESSRLVKAVVGIGCCYHKMTVDEEGDFHHFPLSRCLKHVWNEKHGFRLSPYSLRLACQERVDKWLAKTRGERERHTNFVAFRSLLEVLVRRTGIKAEKLRRHFFREEHMTNFETFEAAVIARVSMDSGDPEQLLNDLRRIHGECEDDIRWIEPYSELQSNLSGVIESLILVDRYLRLTESGFYCSLSFLFDPLVSPRNAAIVAVKMK